MYMYAMKCLCTILFISKSVAFTNYTKSFELLQQCLI